jgi:transcriptional regulator with XRE-family HTH domain
MDDLGKNIRQLREELGLTLEDLAKRTELDQSNLSKIERGIGGFSKKSLGMIATALHVSLGTLFADRAVLPVVLDEGSQLGPGLRIPIDIKAARLLAERKASTRSFALRIKGEANTPYFMPGDVVIIDPELKPEPGDFVAAHVEKAGIAFCQYRVINFDKDNRPIFDLVPLNSFFPTLSPAAQTIQILGTMQEHRRYRKERT